MNLNFQLVIECHCFIEEYDSIFYYISGIEHVLADLFLLFPWKKCIEEKRQPPVHEQIIDNRHKKDAFNLFFDDSKFLTVCWLYLPYLSCKFPSLVKDKATSVWGWRIQLDELGKSNKASTEAVWTLSVCFILCWSI